jgi:coenzyme F420-reducing hydrogenase gamma subunit
MPSRKTRIVILSLIVLATIALTSCGGSSDGAALLESRCAECHDLDRVTNASKSRDDWEVTVDRMMTRGAVLDDAERETLIEYLTETYP